jgi:sensor histidine kinase YesM
MARRSAHSFCIDRSYVLRLTLINTAAAVGAAAIVAWLTRRGGYAEVLRTFCMASIYSFAIGMPCGLVLPFIGEALANWRMSAKMIVIGASILVMVALGGLVAGVLLMWVGLLAGGDFWPQYWFALRVSSVIGVGVGCSAFAYERLRDKLEETKLELRTRELEQERAQKLFAEARLSSLESRIHPHFFFNTLNSIAALIPEDPKRAEDIVNRLAALLRFSLDSGRNSLVPLAQEIKIVRDYLEIEKVRFGERLRYSIDVPPQLETTQVPRLAVQTLVENSVKHAIAARREGGEVRISAQKTDAGLALSVSDTGPGFRLEQAQPGHGIDNLLGRLAVLFGDAAALSTAHEDGRAAVRILVPPA